MDSIRFYSFFASGKVKAKQINTPPYFQCVIRATRIINPRVGWGSFADAKAGEDANARYFCGVRLTREGETLERLAGDEEAAPSGTLVSCQWEIGQASL